MGNRDPRSWNWQTGTRWYSSFSCPATDGRWLAGDEAILVVIHPDVSPGKPQPGRMEAQRGNCAEFIRVTPLYKMHCPRASEASQCEFKCQPFKDDNLKATNSRIENSLKPVPTKSHRSSSYIILYHPISSFLVTSTWSLSCSHRGTSPGECSVTFHEAGPVGLSRKPQLTLAAVLPRDRESSAVPWRPDWQWETSTSSTF